MSQTIKIFVKYSVVIVVLMLSVIFITTTALAVGSNGNENIIASGIANGDEGNPALATTLPDGNGSNGLEGNGTPNGGGLNGNEGNGTPVGGGANGDEGNNAAIIPPDGNPGGSGPSGGSSRNTGGSTSRTITQTITQISDIKVTLAGYSFITTNLARGSTYSISWRASLRNVDTSLSLVSSTGAIVVIGTSTNASGSGINTLNWRVPTSTALGSYTLRFTDPANRITNAPSRYKVVLRGGASDNLGTGGGNLSTGSGAGTGTAAGSAEILPGLSPNPEDLILDQSAAAGNAFTDFWGNKYVLWFLVLLLIIAFFLLLNERRDRKQTPPSPFIKK